MAGNINFFRNDGVQGDYLTWNGDGAQNTEMRFGGHSFVINTSGSSPSYTLPMGETPPDSMYVIQNMLIYNTVGNEPDAFEIQIWRRSSAGSTYTSLYYTIVGNQLIPPGHSHQFFSKDNPLVLGNSQGGSDTAASYNLRIRARGGFTQTYSGYIAYIKMGE